MKFIHCADIHLGSKIESKLKNISKDRQAEVRIAFKKMIEYAVSSDIQLIVLSGDIFDTDNPRIKDKEFFYDAVKSNPTIDFLYLRGNHDCSECLNEEIPNLKTFSNEWTSYRYDNIVFSGIEMNAKNNISLYSSLKLNEEDRNIVLLHGEVGDCKGKDKVFIKDLKGRFIDYLALGHIHSYQEGKIDERGIYVNPGCLVGRGFDELGTKGFMEISIDGSIVKQFIPSDSKKIVEEDVDISAANNNYEALKIVESSIQSSKDDIVRIVIKGDVPFEIENIGEDVLGLLRNRFYFLTIKDKTTKRIDIKKFKTDLSLKGEFIRTVYANDLLSCDQKNEIITLGLKAIQGREID